MGTAQVTVCDHCGKRVDNPYAARGWIQIRANSTGSVSITRAVGKMGRTGHVTDFLRSVTDFCGIACLVAALDAQVRERENVAGDE